MKPTNLSLSFLTLAVSVFSASAQTKAAPTHAAVAHRAPVAASVKTSACSDIPHLSDKIPALPAGDTIKPLFTLTRKADITLDYVSPMVSPEVQEALSPKPMVLSLCYVDTKVGTGEAAKPGKWYTVNYTGYLPDGAKFDSSEGREPISFPYGQHRVIAGWDTGFEGMHVGGKRRLYIPYQLAYGEQGHPPAIPAKSLLVFDMELVSQSDEQPMPKTPPTPPTPAAAPAHAASPAGATTPPPANAPAAATTPAKPEAK